MSDKLNTLEGLRLAALMAKCYTAEQVAELSEVMEDIISDTQLPYTITYDHSYTGTGDKGTADAPVVIQMAKEYDAIAVISVGTDYVDGTEAFRQRMLLELVTGENASTTFGNNWVAIKALSDEFQSGDKYAGLNVFAGKWSYPNTYLRRNGNALECYSSVAAYAWNGAGTHYHVFGISMSADILPVDHYDNIKTADSTE